MDAERLAREPSDSVAATDALLRDSLRRCDVAGIMDACERDASCGLKRKALRFVIGAVPDHWRHFTAASISMGPPSEYRWWQDQCLRVANIARTLPSPQPVDVWSHGCEQCGVDNVIGLSDVEVTFPHRDDCEDSGTLIPCAAVFARKVISPHHALRLYVDALMVAKGSAWFDWLDENFEREEATPGFAHRSMIHPYGRDGCVIHIDGSISWDEQCPPLPEVT